MPANHNVPHTEAAKEKMRLARLGKPAPWRRRKITCVGGVSLYRCGKCTAFFSVDFFHPDKRSQLGIKSCCKRCHNSVSVATRDPARARENRQTAEANRRAKIARAAGRVSVQEWRDVLSILGQHCLCCGSRASITQDHIVPLSRGGMHHPTNLQPLCRPCNERKHARTADFRSTEQRDEINKRWAIKFKNVLP